MGFISSGPGVFEFFRRLMTDSFSFVDVWLDQSSSGCNEKMGGFSRKFCVSWETLSKQF